MKMVGASGFEPPTPTMSRWCSNQLSYAPPERGVQDTKCLLLWQGQKYLTPKIILVLQEPLIGLLDPGFKLRLRLPAQAVQFTHIQ